MTFLPIVERELRVVSRRTMTYWGRVIVAGAAVGVAVFMMLFGAVSGAAAMAGGVMFHTLSYLAVGFCLLEGARKTADCLSEEKREGTLGLLFLTDLKGYDIVFGKLVGKSVSSVYGLVSILPLLALPLLMGGVTGGEYWRMALALFNLLFASLCAGLWVSAWSRTVQQAMSRTFLVMLGWVAVPLLVQAPTLLPFSPLHAFTASFASNYPRESAGYWSSLGITQGLSWLMLAWSSFLVPRSFQDKAVVTQSSWWRKRRRPVSPAVRARMLDRNPALWLAARETERRFAARFLAGIAVAGAAGFVLILDPTAWQPELSGFIGCALVLNLLFKMRLAAQACHCLAEARHNNALEILLATPLTSGQIVTGQVDALKRMFLLPGLIILGAEISALAISSAIVGNDQISNSEILVFGIIYLGLFALDVVAVTWAGMWFGLSSKSESQAAAKTVLWVLIAPMLGSLCWCYGVVFLVACPIFWIVWASQKVRLEFRRLAGQRFGGGPAVPRWTPGTGGAGTNLPGQG